MRDFMQITQLNYRVNYLAILSPINDKVIIQLNLMLDVHDYIYKRYYRSNIILRYTIRVKPVLHNARSNIKIIKIILIIIMIIF